MVEESNDDARRDMTLSSTNVVAIISQQPLAALSWHEYFSNTELAAAFVDMRRSTLVIRNRMRSSRMCLLSKLQAVRNRRELDDVLQVRYVYFHTMVSNTQWESGAKGRRLWLQGFNYKPDIDTTLTKGNRKASEKSIGLATLKSELCKHPCYP